MLVGGWGLWGLDRRSVAWVFCAKRFQKKARQAVGPGELACGGGAGSGVESSALGGYGHYERLWGIVSELG